MQPKLFNLAKALIAYSFDYYWVKPTKYNSCADGATFDLLRMRWPLCILCSQPFFGDGSDWLPLY